MSKDAEFKNRDRYIQLGIAISALRKMRGLSQEQLAERANVSRSHISSIVRKKTYLCIYKYKRSRRFLWHIN